MLHGHDYTRVACLQMLTIITAIFASLMLSLFCTKCDAEIFQNHLLSLTES